MNSQLLFHQALSPDISRLTRALLMFDKKEQYLEREKGPAKQVHNKYHPMAVGCYIKINSQISSKSITCSIRARGRGNIGSTCIEII